MKNQTKEIKNQFREACCNIYSKNMGPEEYATVTRLKDQIVEQWPIRRADLSRIETGVLLRICSGKGAVEDA